MPLPPARRRGGGLGVSWGAGIGALELILPLPGPAAPRHVTERPCVISRRASGPRESCGGGCGRALPRPGTPEKKNRRPMHKKHRVFPQLRRLVVHS